MEGGTQEAQESLRDEGDVESEVSIKWLLDD